MRKKRLSALLLPLILLCCSLPPYDEDLSLAMITAGKMKQEAEIGPLHRWSGEYEGTDYFFVPDKGIFNRGFIIAAGENYIKFQFVENDGMGNYWIDAEDWRPITNQNDKTLNFRVEAVKGGGYINFVRFDSGDYANNELTVLEYFPSNIVNAAGPFILRTEINTDFGFLSIVLGSNIYPDTIGTDEIHFLCKLDTGGYREVSYNINNTGINWGFGIDIRGSSFPLPLPPDLENAFYYYYPGSDTSFISFYYDGIYHNFSWDDSCILKPLTGISTRIDALLTTGELFCRTHNMGYVYNQDGIRQYDFPLGDLHFVYEYYTGSEYRMYFTLAYWLYEDELYFKVYSIPTEDLDELD